MFNLVFRPLMFAPLLVAAAATTPALAAQPMTAHVSFADLDLSSPDGQATLDHRIKVAVNDVCPDVQPRDLLSNHQERMCRAKALTSARVQVASAIEKSQTRMAETAQPAHGG